MSAINRREFTQQAIGSLLTYSLLETLFRANAFADEIKPDTIKWLARVNELAQDVKGQKLKQTEWQKQIEALFERVEIADMLRLIDFEVLTKDLKFSNNGANSLRPKFPKVEGLPTEYVFGRQVFALKKDRSIVPHGHNNMATSFLMLKGECHGRLFDRLKDEPEHILIKPTIDREFKAGQASSISDDKDNVHWFQATSETAFIFNIHVMDIRPGSGESTGRVYLDPNGEKLAGDVIRAKRLDHKESHKLYG